MMFYRRMLSTMPQAILENISTNLLLNTCIGATIGGTCQATLVQSLLATECLKNETLRDAFYQVDRSIFVPEHLKKEAYKNSPLALGYNATISSPQHHVCVVEPLMKSIQPGQSVVDVGCGSGYLTSIFSKLVGPSGCVLGTDIIPDFVNDTLENGRAVGADNIQGYVTTSGGSLLPPEMSFDIIHIGFALPTREMISSLTRALNPNGAMVVPLGTAGKEQRLLLLTKKDGGEIIEVDIMSVMCQLVADEHAVEMVPVKTSSVEEITFQLQEWKRVFENKNGKSATRCDIKNDPHANELFRQFTHVRRKQW